MRSNYKHSCVVVLMYSVLVCASEMMSVRHMHTQRTTAVEITYFVISSTPHTHRGDEEQPILEGGNPSLDAGADQSDVRS